jgi:integrase
MPKVYNSVYAEYIGQFIAMKQSLGFKYVTEGVLLRLFDRFCCQRNESSIGVTKELWEAWITLDPNESTSYRYHRGVCVVQLSLFLNKQGIRSLIPQLPPNKIDFTPYVFSRDQVASFFDAADQMVASKKHMNSIIFSLPCLWRLLYGTGVRIGEALALLEKDVNTEDCYLVIRDSKNGMERMVPMSKSLSEVCRVYRSHKKRLPIRSDRSTPFFVSLNGSVCSRDTVHSWFHKTLTKAGIQQFEHGARIHSFRHSFSVHSLAMMAETGQDIYCSLPVLSSYLGHQSLKSTNAYVRLTAEMYPGLIKDMGSVSLNVFPNPTSYGAN